MQENDIGNLWSETSIQWSNLSKEYVLEKFYVLDKKNEIVKENGYGLALYEYAVDLY